MLETRELLGSSEIVNSLIESFSACKQKLERQAELLAQKITEIEEKMQTTENEIEINTAFEESKKLREQLLEMLIQMDNLQKFISKNQRRLSYITSQLKIEGETPRTIARKDFEKKFEGAGEVSADALNLNGDSTLINIDDNLFVLSGDKIDMNNQKNLDLIKSLEQDKIFKLMSTYPDSFLNLSAENLLDTTLRVKVLKSIANYVFEQSKTKTFTEINDSLGRPLSFRYEIVSTFESYIKAIKNLFKVKIKKWLIENNPEKKEQIDAKLGCNEHSKMLPEDLYVPEKGKPQIEENKELDIDAEIDEFLKNLIGD